MDSDMEKSVLLSVLQFSFGVEEDLTALSLEELKIVAADLGYGADTSEVIQTSELGTETTSGEMDVPTALLTEAITDVTTEVNEGLVMQYCDITGSDPESARHMLEALGWDLDTAVSIFLAEDHQPLPAPSRRPPTFNTGVSRGTSDLNDLPCPPAPPTRSGVAGSREEALRAILEADDATGLMDFLSSTAMPILPAIPPSMSTSTSSSSAAGMFNMMNRRHMMAYGDEDDEDYSPSARREDEYDEYGVRKPDKVKQQRLIDNRSMRISQEEDGFGRADDASVDWMFPPPRHLSSQLSLDSARQQAQTEGRWLLVNLQSHQEFTSQLLNRDVWTNETIDEILRTTFLFWQRGHTSGDGIAYMRMHRIQDDDLPHIGVIDPRTGARLLTLTGLMTPDELAVRLMEFNDQNNMQDNKVNSRGGSRIASRSGSNLDLSLDETLVRSAMERVQHISSGSGSGSCISTSTSSSSGFANGDVSDVIGIASNSSMDGIAAATMYDDSDDIDPPNVFDFIAPEPEIDYGDVPTEPPAEDKVDSLRVSIKLPNGKSLVRRYRKSDLVRVLFAVAVSLVKEHALCNPTSASLTSFDLVTTYPNRSLKMEGCLESTLNDSALGGSQVMLRWL